MPAMEQHSYLMENDQEIARLELKTDTESVLRQARWAGLRPGMRVADIGCGPGKTSAVLHDLVSPGGSVVGVDASEDRICYALKSYNNGVEFRCKNFLEPLDDLGTFDFVWVRFVLEYYRANSFDLVKNISKIVKPGGIICLIDLDYNCMNHYSINPRLEKTIAELMKQLQLKADFDPFVGRKLYTYLYDLDFEEIDVQLAAHHLTFGTMKTSDAFNWKVKMEVISRKLSEVMQDYEGGYSQFEKDFQEFIDDPRRFTYTPVISCRGRKSCS